jgi:hypothetical protein
VLALRAAPFVDLMALLEHTDPNCHAARLEGQLKCISGLSKPNLRSMQGIEKGGRTGRAGHLFLTSDVAGGDPWLKR